VKRVRPKKQLGQHFLKDETIAEKTVAAFGERKNFNIALEIGPGMGVLSKYLLRRGDLTPYLIEIDGESIEYLKNTLDLPEGQIIHQDFLNMDLATAFKREPLGIVGNFPYNISTQILFKVYEYRYQVKEVVGMFQKEVADRICSPPGSKVYGITSVLLQAYYDIDYLFTVDEQVFDPPPKVKSAVIRLKRNATHTLSCDEVKFKQVVKMAFNQRRKTLRNSLKPLLSDELKVSSIFSKRPEQLNVEEFVKLTNLIY
jgi:16S rRNA (adenine1518-N6/adenine1519-N6)-dimethyltransferase